MRTHLRTVSTLEFGQLKLYYDSEYHAVFANGVPVAGVSDFEMARRFSFYGFDEFMKEPSFLNLLRSQLKERR